jgi:hypothetical protein
MVDFFLLQKNHPKGKDGVCQEIQFEESLKQRLEIYMSQSK